MSDPTLNVLAANQQIGQLNEQLRIEKEARAAVQSDLEAAKAAHLEEVQALKDAHAGEITTLKGEHAKSITELTDQLEEAKNEIETLKGDAKSASEKAAEIVGKTGGDAADTDNGDDANDSGPATKEELKALYAEQAAIVDPVAKHQFYQDRIKPRLQGN